MEITTIGILEGYRKKTTTTGKLYAELFFKCVESNGEVSFEQNKVTTWNENVVNNLEKLHVGELYSFKLICKDLVLQNVEKE